MPTKLLRVLNKALIVGVLVSAASFFLKMTPCRKLPSAALNSTINATVGKAGLGFCALPNPFRDLSPVSSGQYYGVSNNPITGLVLQFLVPAVLFFIIYMSIRRKAGKTLDLTRK